MPALPDTSESLWVMAFPSETAVGGRGLRIIEDVCDRWGVHVVQDRKCVGCERDLP